MVPRPTNAGKYSRITTQRPSTPTTAFSVRISSFGNGTPQAGNPIHRQKQQSLYSYGSRLAPLTRRVANEPSSFGLGISHRTLQLPTSFRPFPTRQNNSTAPPPPTRLVSTEHLCPGPLHCRRGAPAESPTPFSTPTCYERAALLRSPPIPPIPRPTACTLLTTLDPTEPLCTGPAFQAEAHRLAMFPADSRIATIPSILLGWLRRRSVPDTADHLEKATALLLTVWLVLLSTNVGPPTAPFSRLPWPEPSRLYQVSNGTSRPVFQFTYQRNQASDGFSVFPQPQQTHGVSIPTKLFSNPPTSRIQTTNGPSAFLDLGVPLHRGRRYIYTFGMQRKKTIGWWRCVYTVRPQEH